MNTLSWFLYFADVAGGLKVMFGVAGAQKGLDLGTQYVEKWLKKQLGEDK